MIENIQLFHTEITSVGLSISGCSSSGNIHFLSPDENNLAPLVLAAHGKLLSSDECLALQAAVSEDVWDKYVEARKQPIRSQRVARYKEEADPLILSSLESALITLTPTEGKYDVVLPEESVSQWLQIKSSIREDLPYEE